MLYEICKHLKNFFPDVKNQREGRFTIAGNSINPSFTLANQRQYFLIEGSAMNDGIHQLTDAFNDEAFEGTITPLKIPNEIIALSAEIKDYVSAHKASEYDSESFGGYSYTKAKNRNGGLAGWQDAFATRLNAWRKI